MTRSTIARARLLPLLLASAACSSSAPTQLVVLVNSDYRPVTELSSIGVAISFMNEGPIASTRLKLGDPIEPRAPGTYVLPLSFGIGPKEGNLSDRVTIELTAFAPSSTETVLLTRRAVTGFIDKKTLLLPMFLARSCERLTCPMDQTCTENDCAPVEIDPKSLRSVAPGKETAGIDAGSRDLDAGSGADGGAPDSGVRPGEPLVVPNGQTVVLMTGVHDFSTLTVEPSATLRATGLGALELRASGDVVIDGTIDVSGGRGGDGVLLDCGSAVGGGGSGGPTLSGERGPNAMAGTCPPFSTGGDGAMGAPGLLRGVMACNGGGRFGGGLGGAPQAGGAGGGGYAGGGGGGAAGLSATGGSGASAAGGTGGVGGQPIRGGMGGAGTTPYAGSDGLSAASFMCAGSSVPRGAGGGGGAIGLDAAADLAIATTFRSGSGGGGGGGGLDDGGRMTCRNHLVPGGGGGGGGGALRITSQTSITVHQGGSILANGGAGGNSPHPGCGPGGGGSGGVIVLRAPRIQIETDTRVAAAGGLGGVPAMASYPGCTNSGRALGGEGGLGRIRLSVDPARCTLGGTWNPPLMSGCAPTAQPMPGFTYIGTYPD